MKTPPLPDDEAGRLLALDELSILDTPVEERFDRYTRIACRLFAVPIALVSLVDGGRQWFKSCRGLTVRQTPRDISFCGHAILDDQTFLVPDATADPRFCDNPLVTGDPHIRFYAGHPLTVHGHRVGTLCLIDRMPRDLDGDERVLLRDLAEMVRTELVAVELATVDPLTGLSNRRGFDQLTRRTLAHCARTGEQATLVLFDLDDFKGINDRHGHAVGDRAIVEFAAVLQAQLRESDVIGRIGGDEFVALLPGANEVQAQIAMARVRKALRARNAVDARFALTCSAGTAPFRPGRNEGLDEVLALADLRMYEDKARRRAA